MRTTVRVTCPACDGAREVLDERGILVVCGACMGQGFHDENPDGPACSIEAHEQADGSSGVPRSRTPNGKAA